MASFRQEQFDSRATGTCVGAAVRRALIKLFLDTIISHEKRSVPDREPSHVSDRKPNDRFKNRFRKPVTGSEGVTRLTKPMHVTEEDPNPEEEESGEEETNLTAVQWMKGPRFWKNWKTRWTYRTWKICESFQSPCTKDSPPSVRHTQS